MSQPSFALYVHDDRSAMGAAAARSAAVTLRRAIAERGEARMIAAAAPSQNETYRALANEPDIDWSRVTVFHMDEYVGLAAEAPQRFANWLRVNFIDAIQPQTFHALQTEGASETAMARYAELLSDGPIDLVCLGIGVNGHIAFNDPPEADLEDPESLREVALDLASRVQQVDDGCFAQLDDVPTHAVTLTIPALFRSAHLVCSVPDVRKADAVKALVEEKITADWPCTVMRRHSHVEVHVDRDAASKIPAGAA